MRLKKAQKEALLQWIAEGLMSDEINVRAASFEPAFQVTRQNVDQYRKRHAIQIDELRKKSEYEALNAGLAIVAVRVRRLQELARIVEKDLFSGERETIWLPQVKSIGSGLNAQIVDYEEFNRSEFETYRGILDDIARETGGRGQKVDIRNLDLSSLTDEQLERLSKGEDLYAVLAGKGTG